MAISPNQIGKIILSNRRKLIFDIIEGMARDINELVRKSLGNAPSQLLDDEFEEAFTVIFREDVKDYRNVCGRYRPSFELGQPSS